MTALAALAAGTRVRTRWGVWTLLGVARFPTEPDMVALTLIDEDGHIERSVVAEVEGLAPVGEIVDDTDHDRLERWRRAAS